MSATIPPQRHDVYTKSARMTLKRRRQLAGVVFALPAIALVVGFIGIPIGQAIYYSFTQWNGLTSTWIGTRPGLRLPQHQPLDRVTQ